MRTNKLLNQIGFLFFLLNSSGYAGPMIIGDGGDTIRLPDGEVIPADYKVPGFEDLPEGLTPISLNEKYPGLIDEVRYQMSFITSRTGGQNLFRFKPEEFEYFSTESLSVNDNLVAGDEYESVPTTATYVIPALNNVRKVIEIKPSRFDLMTQKHQAQQLIHEYLHQNVAAGHSTISPFITHLDQLINLSEKQKSDHSYLPTKSELQSSERFQGILNYYFGERNFYSIISQKGAGVIFVKGKGEIDHRSLQTNIVDVSSTVVIESEDTSHLKNGTIFQSNIEINTQGKDCEMFYFQDVSLSVACQGKNISLVNVKSDVPFSEGKIEIFGKELSLEAVHLAENSFLRVEGDDVDLFDLRICGTMEVAGHTQLRKVQAGWSLLKKSLPCSSKAKSKVSAYLSLTDVTLGAGQYYLFLKYPDEPITIKGLRLGGRFQETSLFGINGDKFSGPFSPGSLLYIDPSVENFAFDTSSAFIIDRGGATLNSVEQMTKDYHEFLISLGKDER